MTPESSRRETGAQEASPQDGGTTFGHGRGGTSAPASRTADDLYVELSHCGFPMRYIGARIGWEGEYEHVTGQWRCETCGLLADVVTREHVGPPGGTP